MSVTFHILAIVATILALILTGTYVRMLPELMRHIVTPRAASTIEGSVRMSRDRNFLALSLLPATVLLCWRYRLWNPDFLENFSADGAIGLTSAAIVVYLLLREFLELVLRPRRSSDSWTYASRLPYTFLVLAATLILPSTGLLAVFGAPDKLISLIIKIELIIVYLLLLLRRGQIISQSCASLTTFLYLCGLELLPTAILVATSMIF
ncbi:MAG: hypothetical protein IKR69_03110 [Bacteroidales bacterium]|nr:hypothetical protein [Bacteroidales bacterium]